jgi:hypothetical protein
VGPLAGLRAHGGEKSRIQSREASRLKSQTFKPSEKREFNAFWLAMKDRGLCSVDCARDVKPGQFSTRWVLRVGYFVNWREKSDE